MRIIISPAKKMRVDRDLFPCTPPQFLSKTQVLLSALQAMSDSELQTLWRCNDRLAAQNAQRVRTMELYRGLTPALLAYEGIQYRYMAPHVFTDAQFRYVAAHLFILSGFYGVLRPFDGVTPYRLEMQAKLKIGQHETLYSFWGDTIAKAICTGEETVLNLASEEYSRCVSAYLPAGTRMVNCIFGEWQDEKIVEKGVYCKMARGEMVRFLAEEASEELTQCRRFNRLGYRFSPQRSDETTYVFIREHTKESSRWGSGE